MSETKTGVARLHHNAWVTRDQEATRQFYEDLIGLPLVATWSEADELFGAERVYCHTFFGLADGSALAFFQFANPKDQELFGPTMPETPFSHIALKVEPTPRTRWPGGWPRPATRSRPRSCSSTATAGRCTSAIRTACSSS